MSRYLVIIEQSNTGVSAYLPDLPGCVATGVTREEVEKEMHDAIAFHLEGLRLRMLVDAEGISLTPQIPSAKILWF
jgi:predicted RNase H-like HicB family nuclease